MAETRVLNLCVLSAFTIPASTASALETQTISLRDRHVGFSASVNQPLAGASKHPTENLYRPSISATLPFHSPCPACPVRSTSQGLPSNEVGQCRRCDITPGWQAECFQRKQCTVQSTKQVRTQVLATHHVSQESSVAAECFQYKQYTQPLSV